MENNFYGIYPPMITPFKKNGEVDQETLVDIANFLVDKGCHGLFLTGSYGAMALMNEAERKLVAEVVLKQVGNKTNVLVQVGCPGTNNTIELAKHAEGLGAKAVSAVTPFYYSNFAYDGSHILKHYEAICKAVKVPVYIYNNPKTTGFKVSPALLLKLAEVGVMGMKDSSGEAALFGDFVNNVRPKYPNFNFMVGTTGLMLDSNAFGCKGTVAGTANVFPELILDLYNALENEEYNKAFELELKVIRVRELQGLEGFRPSACYSILRMRGINPGEVRLPWKEFSESSYQFVESEFKKMGLL